MFIAVTITQLHPQGLYTFFNMDPKIKCFGWKLGDKRVHYGTA